MACLNILIRTVAGPSRNASHASLLHMRRGKNVERRLCCAYFNDHPVKLHFTYVSSPLAPPLRGILTEPSYARIKYLDIYPNFSI